MKEHLKKNWGWYVFGILFLFLLSIYLFSTRMSGQSRWDEFFNPPTPRGNHNNNPPQLVPVK